MDTASGFESEISVGLWGRLEGREGFKGVLDVGCWMLEMLLEYWGVV